MEGQLRVELLVGLDDAFGRTVARGVIRYAKAHPAWRLYAPDRLFPDIRELDGGPGREAAGIIARIESAEAARAFSAMRVPVADVAGAFPGGFLKAINDDFLTGRRAGEYLRGLGFKRFAFCGVEKVEWSRRRRAGFLEACGIESDWLPRFERPLAWWKSRAENRDSLAVFLESLTFPAALFACNDIAGLKIAETCRQRGIAVPEDLALLGTDDEDLLCELADPALSSVRLDCERIGWSAAELLDRTMRGGEGERSRSIPPTGVSERASTLTAACEDRAVSRALIWIKANAFRGIDASDVTAAVALSRRSLERRFRAFLGITPHQAIAAARVESAKRLLATTDLPLDAIAERSGFGGLQRLHAVFKSAEGLSPGAWKKRRRDSAVDV